MKDLLIGIVTLIGGIYFIILFLEALYRGPESLKTGLFSFFGNFLLLGITCYLILENLEINSNSNLYIILFASFYLFFYVITWIFFKKRLEKAYGKLTGNKFLLYIGLCAIFVEVF